MKIIAYTLAFLMGLGAWISASKFRAIVFMSVAAVMVAVAG